MNKEEKSTPLRTESLKEEVWREFYEKKQLVTGVDSASPSRDPESGEELKQDPAYSEESQKEFWDNLKEESGVTTKDTNPKESVGVRKVPMSVMSGPVFMEVGLGMMEGALKYGRHNYREAGVRASVYIDALQRHIWDWWEGEDIDPDSGLNHITKAISTLMVLRDSMIRENWVDDRPPKVKAGWMKELNKKAGELIDKYPNPVPAYTHKKS